MTSHFSLSKVTLQPALHKGRIPTRDATANPGTICPRRGCGSPGIMKSHMCVDFTLFPSGKLIVIGCVAMRLLSTSTPSIMKMDVAPVSAMACFESIVIAFNALWEGMPNRWCAAAVRGCGRGEVTGATLEQFDVTIVRSSSSSAKLTA